jgi:hypothetical protein
MVAESARRHVLEVIRDVSRLEAIVDQPNEVVRAALGQIIPVQSSTTTHHQRAAA